MWSAVLKRAKEEKDGLVLESAELGRVKITDSFVEPDSSRLRLKITCPADHKGRLGITLSSSGNIIRRLSSRSVVAAEGLLRKGDVVIAADGKALGQTTLEEALSVQTREHTLVVHRTDPALCGVIMKAPPLALSRTYAAPFLRARIDLTRMVGRSDTVRLGLNVNAYNGVVYIVPGGPVAHEGTLQVGDVVVEVNGEPLGASWLVEVLEAAPLTGESCTLAVVRLPSAPGDERTRAIAERASRKRGYLPEEPREERRTMHGGKSAWQDHREALQLSGGYLPVAQLVLRGRIKQSHLSATHIEAVYRGLAPQRVPKLARRPCLSPGSPVPGLRPAGDCLADVSRLSCSSRDGT